MRSFNTVWFTILLAVLLAACGTTAAGGGGGFAYNVQDAGNQTDTAALTGVDSTSGTDITTAGAGPKIAAVDLTLFDGNVFPTYISHLFGTAQFGTPPTTLQFVRTVTVNNPTSSPVNLSVTAELQGYSFPATVNVAVTANGTTTTAVPLTFKTDALFAVSATQASNLVVTLADGAQTVDTFTQQVQIAPKNTVFWKKTSSTGVVTDVSPLVGVMVTPHDKDKQVDKLLTAAAGHSYFNAMLGYQALGKSVKSSADVVAGACQEHGVFYQAGEPVSVNVSVTCSVCLTYNAQYYLVDDANHNLYKAGSNWQYMLGNEALGSFSDSTTIPADGHYWHMACNPSSNSSDRQYTITRTIGANEAAIDQVGAVFLALKAMGMVYTSVTAAYFDSAQNVKTPAESLESGSENCIDGTLVFASALESMGMESAIVKVPGHAFVAVRVAPGVDDWVFVETTMVSSATVADAVSFALQEANNYKQAGTATMLKVSDLRAQGINPGPY